jgi:hypothetical protein
MAANITVLRYSTTEHDTLGMLLLNGRFQCYTLEDPPQQKKIAGNTRIPAGEYKFTLRTFGTHHDQYSGMFRDFHKGMIWIRDIPEFENVLIHIGNESKDTKGCLLVGDSVNNNQTERAFLGASKVAYVRMYQNVLMALGGDSGGLIEIRDVAI